MCKFFLTPAKGLGRGVNGLVQVRVHGGPGNGIVNEIEDGTGSEIVTGLKQVS